MGAKYLAIFLKNFGQFDVICFGILSDLRLIHGDPNQVDLN